MVLLLKETRLLDSALELRAIILLPCNYPYHSHTYVLHDSYVVTLLRNSKSKKLPDLT